jgi:hypothetical protein
MLITSLVSHLAGPGVLGEQNFLDHPQQTTGVSAASLLITLQIPALLSHTLMPRLTARANSDPVQFAIEHRTRPNEPLFDKHKSLSPACKMVDLPCIAEPPGRQPMAKDHHMQDAEL